MAGQAPSGPPASTTRREHLNGQPSTGPNPWTSLFGVINNGSVEVQNAMVSTRAWSFALFVQDDFKITQRLTVNYGLRLDIMTPLVEANDYYSMVDTTKPNPAAGNLPGVYVFAGQNGVGGGGDLEEQARRFAPLHHSGAEQSPRGAERGGEE